MKTLWYIAKKDLLQVLKDRNSLIFLFAVPLVLVAVIGLAFGNFFEGLSGSNLIEEAGRFSFSSGGDQTQPDLCVGGLGCGGSVEERE